MCFQKKVGTLMNNVTLIYFKEENCELIHQGKVCDKSPLMHDNYNYQLKKKTQLHCKFIIFNISNTIAFSMSLLSLNPKQWNR